LDDDGALTALLFPEDAKALAERPEPDWTHVHAELKKKGVTKARRAAAATPRRTPRPRTTSTMGLPQFRGHPS